MDGDDLPDVGICKDYVERSSEVEMKKSDRIKTVDKNRKCV
jgi:hypothetical protein